LHYINLIESDIKYSEKYFEALLHVQNLHLRITLNPPFQQKIVLHLGCCKPYEIQDFRSSEIFEILEFYLINKSYIPTLKLQKIINALL
jgi:hypothetical protein